MSAIIGSGLDTAMGLMATGVTIGAAGAVLGAVNRMSRQAQTPHQRIVKYHPAMRTQRAQPMQKVRAVKISRAPSRPPPSRPVRRKSMLHSFWTG